MRLHAFAPRFLVLTAFALLGASAPAWGQGKLVQSLDAFYSPSAAVLAADGQTLFVTNAARGDYGMFAARGAVSRVKIAADGVISVDNARLVEGLNAPLGLALTRTAIAEIPAGSIAVTIGGTWVVDGNGRAIADDRVRATGVAFFDATSGKDLGRIFMGRGSRTHKALGHPVVDPGSLAADAAGNLYLSDVAGAGLRPLAAGEGESGVVKISKAALAALLRDEEPAEGGIAFATVTEIPTGLAYTERDQSLYWVTGSGVGVFAGAIMRVRGGDFGPSGAVEDVSRKHGALACVSLVPGGGVLACSNAGEFFYLREGKGRAKQIKFSDKTIFLSPGQPAVVRLADQKLRVIVPELSGGGRGPWRQRLAVFELPANF